MQLIRRTLSLVLACLVLVWAGAACAEDAWLSATELGEQVQVDQLGQTSLDLDGADPENSPAVISVFDAPAVFLLGARPPLPLPEFRSVFPRPTSPPPRQA